MTRTIRFLSRYLPKSNVEHTMMQMRPPDLPENPCILKVALLGAPNSGKSTIFNNLLGRKISAVSSKENTTRHRITGVFTDRNCQIVFLDTPGIFPPWKLKSKIKLEKSVLLDPQSSLWEADLIMFIHDASNKFTQYKFVDELLKCLFAHPNKESVLVLNKVDMIKRKKLLLDITWKLTEGQLNGVTYMPKPNSKDDISKRKLVDPEWIFKNTDSLIDSENKLNCITEGMNDQRLNILKQLEIDMLKYLEKPAKNNNSLICNAIETHQDSSQISNINSANNVISSPKEFAKDISQTSDYHLYYQKLSTASRFVKSGITSWPYFNQVFMVSASRNDGLAELKRYLLSRCKPGNWMFHRDIMTDQYPQDIALMLIREIMFEMLPQEIPYSLEMTVEKWYLDPDLDVLFITITIFPREKAYSRDVGALLKNHGEAVKAIANAAQDNLMESFRCDVCLKLNVKLKPA